MTSSRAVIIGGGIAGLTAAYRLVEKSRQSKMPLDVVLLEAAPRTGGIISSTIHDGAVIEEGPDSFLSTKPEALRLAQELDLDDQIIETNPENRRAFVAFRKKLHPLPEGFFMAAPGLMIPFLQSSLFTSAGKARMLMDVGIPRGTANGDESIASFVRRRLGNEALQRAAQPMLAGIYTGDAERLSIRSAMPQFIEMERQFGSVIVGVQEMMRKRSANQGDKQGLSGARYSMFLSLKNGMRSLSDRLAERIGAENIRCSTRVTALHRENESWVVETSGGDRLNCQFVIVTASAQTAATLISQTNCELAEKLARIEYASSVVINMIYRRGSIPHPLDGFGFVVPAIERRSLLACTFSSVKFDGRAPEGCVSMRCFMGGTARPDLIHVGENELVSLARRDLKHYIGVSEPPIWHNLSRWPRSMPQYNIGHQERVAQIERLAGEIPGLSLAGNSYHGVGIPDCVRSGEASAEKAWRHLTAVATR